ncbi:MAG: type II toxin-antitoxin system VapC family toxin, partial [bacterium]|nr:type II toxin-antitoxin system VapC family toxin [bacterium]
TAADLSLEFRLAMADAIVYATARSYQVELVTSDADFVDLPEVTYIPKPDKHDQAPVLLDSGTAPSDPI